jgi:hypothetical protein
MKHLKTYEENTFQDLRLGDYVLCKIEMKNVDRYFDINYLKFIEDNIGKVVLINENGGYVRIEYDKNVPGNDMIVNYTFLDINNIKYYSKNREDLEEILSAKRYNL